MKKFIVATIISFLFVGCGLDKDPHANEFILDNPTDQSISVKVDDAQYKLAPLSREKLTLEVGKHSMQWNNQTTEFVVYDGNKGGVLNPTNSTYYKFNMAYAMEGHENRVSPLEHVIYIDSIEYNVPADIIKGVVIDNGSVNATYSLDEPFPEEITVYGDQTKDIKSKLFSKNDFINFIEKETDTKGYHEENKIKSTSAPTTEKVEPVVYEVPNFKNGKLKQAAEKLVELDKAYAKAYTASEQKSIMKDYKKAWENYVQISIDKESKEYDPNDVDLESKFKINNLGKGIVVISE
ncbi:MAG: hypothetical protein LBQ84_05765 [Flavobacteriaceae bacterium]|jgi:hypothetical protein|nr:hypothetical protein [Flavobacteriaceae bacterium]